MKKVITLFALLAICILPAAAQSFRPVHIGFCYPLSTNGTEAPLICNGASFHVLAGVSAGESSFCLSGLVSSVNHNAQSVLISGLVSRIGKDATGLVLSGCTGLVSGEVNGVQCSGFNSVARSVNGLQLSGFSGLVRGSVSGAQISGFVSIARQADNQLSGFCNVVDTVNGVQMAGFINVASSVTGLQSAGFVNAAKDVNGTQLAGFVNIARRVKGVQVAGFINIADSCEYPVGLINIIRSGEQWLGLEADETGSAFVSFRSGSRRLYGILAAGLNYTTSDPRYALQGGIGMHSFQSKRFRLKTELTLTAVTSFDDGVYMRSALRVLPSVRFGDRIEIYGGITGGFVNTPQRSAFLPDVPYLWEHRSNGTFYGISIGAVAGLQISL